MNNVFREAVITKRKSKTLKNRNYKELSILYKYDIVTFNSSAILLFGRINTTVYFSLIFYLFLPYNSIIISPVRVVAVQYSMNDTVIITSIIFGNVCKITQMLKYL